jgi:hypothetical protein
MRCEVMVRLLAVAVFALWLSACDRRQVDSNPPAATPAAQTSSSSTTSDAAGPGDPVEQVLANLRSQPVGNHTAAVYNLPEPFQRVVAERIVRASFEDNFRIVVHDSAPPPAKPSQPPTRETYGDGRAIVRVLDHHPAAVHERFQSQTAEIYPPLIGYRATILNAEQSWPFDAPGADASPQLRAAYDLVTSRLAVDGLLLTTARAIAAIGADQFDEVPERDASRDLLRAAGLPVDLINFCHSPDGGDIVQWIARQLLAGESAETLQPRLMFLPFEFQQTKPGFRIATESGEHEIDTIRLQLTRGSYWRGVGDGGNIDLTRQLIEQLPNVSFIASIQRTHADQFVALARSWRMPHEAPLTVVRENLPVAQWAHDNGKGGFIRDESGAMTMATIVPRYASRGEAAAAFVPGETLLLDGLAEAGQHLFQSPLHFQGGNLLAVRDPATGQRILLIGEAEIHRNRLLGLTAAGVISAFQIEFGVDRCEVLPTVSFHIDYDVSIRAHDGKLIAFVNDTFAACRIILHMAVQAMQAAGALDDAAAKNALANLHSGNWRDFLTTVGNRILAMGGERGRFPASFADLFSEGDVDSGIGNMHLILQAIDTMNAVILKPDDWPWPSSTRMYYQLLAKREKGRAALRTHLERLRFAIVDVPSLADQARGANAINGVHARGTYLMPAYAGWMSELDAAAAAAYKAALGSAVEIRPVECAESQRRAGAIHCSASILYSP